MHSFLPALSGLLLLVGVHRPLEAPLVEIVRFHGARGTRLVGKAAASSLTLRSTAPGTRTLWVGYSVQDPDGRWHDVPSHPVVLRSAEESPPQRKTWTVPPGAIPGPYRVVMAVWSTRPEEGGAVRLASVSEENAFRVEPEAGARSHSWERGWHAGDHALGRGRVRPEHVLPRGEGGRLRLAAGSCDGAEVRTDERYLNGEYRVRMRTPRAPGSISAFFLYEDTPGGNDEIDVEILNDGSRRMILAVWVGGEQTHEKVIRLPFDPAAELHEYTIHFRPGELRFLVDGRLRQRWTRRLPERPMRVVANTWWPTWLECVPPREELHTEVEWIRF